eukprot:jgi/Chlat1/2959/Chrsp2S04693
MTEVTEEDCFGMDLEQQLAEVEGRRQELLASLQSSWDFIGEDDGARAGQLVELAELSLAPYQQAAIRVSELKQTLLHEIDDANLAIIQAYKALGLPLEGVSTEMPDGNAVLPLKCQLQALVPKLATINARLLKASQTKKELQVIRRGGCWGQRCFAHTLHALQCIANQYRGPDVAFCLRLVRGVVCMFVSSVVCVHAIKH